MPASSPAIVALALALAAPPAPIDRRADAPEEPLPSSVADAPAAAGTARAPAAAAADAATSARATEGPVELVQLVGERRPVYVGCGSTLPACERLTIVATVAGGLGLAAVLGAGGLLVTPDRRPQGEPTTSRSAHEVGTTLLAVGVGLVTTSVLMILTATRAANRERRRRLSSR